MTDHRSVCFPDVCGGPTRLAYGPLSYAAVPRLVLTLGVWMPVGIVKWYDGKKGFGFILDGQGVDVFVHYTVIEGEGYRCLRDGEQVEYDVTQGPKGLLASRVKRLNPTPARTPRRNR